MPLRPFRWLLATSALSISLLAVLPSRAAEPVDAGWILARLERPVPSRTPFLELRGSALLEAPLRVSGEYRRPGEDVLVREVTAPHPETTTIAEGGITIERNGKARRFPLSRAPELAGLQAGFGALLRGDEASLRKHFTLSSEGTQRDWRLRLAPRDAALARRLEAIVLFGHGAEVRCIETHPAEGDVQRTLLAGTAVDATGIADAGALAALCHGD